MADGALTMGRLTPREREIVRLAAAGLRTRDVAARLGISRLTVAVHLANIYRKIGVAGRLELLLYAQAHGIAPVWLSTEASLRPIPDYRSTEWEILNAMQTYGGSFVRQLAVLYRLADPENQRTLATAFAHYFAEYDALAVLHARQQESR